MTKSIALASNVTKAELLAMRIELPASIVPKHPHLIQLTSSKKQALAKMAELEALGYQMRLTGSGRSWLIRNLADNGITSSDKERMAWEFYYATRVGRTSLSDALLIEYANHFLALYDHLWSLVEVAIEAPIEAPIEAVVEAPIEAVVEAQEDLIAEALALLAIGRANCFDYYTQASEVYGFEVKSVDLGYGAIRSIHGGFTSCTESMQEAVIGYNTLATMGGGSFRSQLLRILDMGYEPESVFDLIIAAANMDYSEE